MSLLKAFKGWKELVKLTVFRKAPKQLIAKPTAPKLVKYECERYPVHTNGTLKFANTFLKVISRTSRLVTRQTLQSLQPRYAGIHKLRWRNMPMFSLVGLSLGLDTDAMTSNYLDQTMTNLRDIFKDYKWEPECLEACPQSLEDMEINTMSVIGKGCEGAVFEAKIKSHANTEDVKPDNLMNRQDYNLAVKAVFNYCAESNASSILRKLNREVVPLQSSESKPSLLDESASMNLSRLPPHPNVVDMQSIFIDDMLVTDEGRKEFPAALPHHVDPETCFGRNKTVYLVMRKCTTKLSNFLSSDVSMKTRCLLLVQLLEAVHHMTSHGVAHRDMKADNILIDVPISGGTPRLQVCDFGCCLAEENRSLVIPYVNSDVNIGGNMCLMAPEIACAKPGENCVLDFRKSDLWACGTLAYQIFGADNPFYRNQDGSQQLKSQTYSEDELPPLPDDVPLPIQRLVRSLLSRDPSERPLPSTAVLVIHMVLWESIRKQQHGNRKRLHPVVVTKGKKSSKYVHYRNKERQKMGLVLAEMFHVIRKISSTGSDEQQDTTDILNVMCLSRLTPCDFMGALKYFER